MSTRSSRPPSAGEPGSWHHPDIVTPSTHTTQPGSAQGTPGARDAPDARVAPDAPTHACVRCGAPVALSTALCETCNPLGLAQPASSQAHGTVLLGVAGAVVLLAFLARLSLSGIGPFEGRVVGVRGGDTGLAVTLSVDNHGSSVGQATCRVTDPAARFGGASGYVLTPRIAAGETLTFETEIRQLGASPRPLVVECSGP